MKLSSNWLRKYISLNVSSDKIAEALTARGIEVEEILAQGEGLDNVITAKVVEREQHPDADKLSVCQVDTGSEILQIVCGAPNVAAGQVVLLAQVGAILPENFKIKKSKIRGIESLGMICAEDELGLGNSHEGILVLPEDTPVGIPLTDVPDLCDTVYDLSITPNRPDALSHIGCARELASFFETDLTLPKLKQEPTLDLPHVSSKKLVVEEPNACSQYVLRSIKNVKVGPSPSWLVTALESVGQKSINNVVDVTNYVLLEFGQPSHAFDAKKLQGDSLVVRYAKEGEVLQTLDEENRTLSSQDLVIADSQNPACLAGVMGGELSKVDESTTEVLLETAYFNPSVVRKQARKHGLSTDSSYRFERGVNPLHTVWISEYLVELLCEVTGGTATLERTCATSEQHPKEALSLSLRLSKIAQVLGCSLEWNSVLKMLGSIEIVPSSLEDTSKDHLESLDAICFTIPGYRPDVTREIDLIEEVARLYDFNNIPASLPRFAVSPTSLPPVEKLAFQIREQLSAVGLNECMSLRFAPQNHQDLLLSPEGHPNRVSAVSLKNPLSEEWEVLPTNLLHNLLKACSNNQRNQEKACRFFEVGKTFKDAPKDRNPKNPGVEEEDSLAIALWGNWETKSWDKTGQQGDFYILKGLVENLLQKLGLSYTLGYDSIPEYLHPSESFEIKIHNQTCGTFGTLHPKVAKNYGIKGTLTGGTLSLSAILAKKQQAKKPSFQKFTPFSQYSATHREMNILVEERVAHAQILAWMPLKKAKNLQSVDLNSIYQGEGVPQGYKAMHYTFTYRSTDKTLSDKEVNQVQEKIASELGKQPEITFK
jgi:phenylalanyl-tRNA synthetase beta chain